MNTKIALLLRDPHDRPVVDWSGLEKVVRDTFERFRFQVDSFVLGNGDQQNEVSYTNADFIVRQAAAGDVLIRWVCQTAVARFFKCPDWGCDHLMSFKENELTSVTEEAAS